MKMKNLTKLLIGSMMVMSTAAFADGFVCSSESGLNVKVYNKTSAEEGTRNAGVMIISDSNVSDGKKTIARFQADNGVLNNAGASYAADVDLRFNDSNLKGRNIGGTKFGFLKQINLDVDFLYSQPVEKGATLKGTLTLIKRNGDSNEIELTCTRYLKAE